MWTISKATLLTRILSMAPVMTGRLLQRIELDVNLSHLVQKACATRVRILEHNLDEHSWVDGNNIEAVGQ